MTLYEAIRDCCLGTALAIFLPLTVAFGIDFIYPHPPYQFAFCIALVMGIIAIIIGTILKRGFISGGFMLGGLLSILYGYFYILGRSAGLRFSLFLIALMVIIILSLLVAKKKFKSIDFFKKLLSY